MSTSLSWLMSIVAQIVHGKPWRGTDLSGWVIVFIFNIVLLSNWKLLKRYNGDWSPNKWYLFDNFMFQRQNITYVLVSSCIRMRSNNLNEIVGFSVLQVVSSLLSFLLFNLDIISQPSSYTIINYVYISIMSRNSSEIQTIYCKSWN